MPRILIINAKFLLASRRCESPQVTK